MSDEISNSGVAFESIVVGEHVGKFDPNNVKFLVYGESGSGKTVFASTFPNVVFLDIDKGLASVKRRVGSIDISTYQQFKDAITYLRSFNPGYLTVVCDSLNELQTLIMRDTIVKYPSIRRAYDNLASQSDYGKMLDEFDKCIRDLKALPLNVVYIAQAAPKEYETDPTQPQLVGKSTARNLCRAMDIVGYIYKAESTVPEQSRIMLFDAANFTTKDRSGRLPQAIYNPTYEALLPYWTE